MNRQKIIFLSFLLNVAFLTHLGCKPVNSVILWPSNPVHSIPEIDNQRQIEALTAASPRADAEQTFALGDFRFIGDRFVMPRFQGVQYDHIVHDLVERNGFKVIAYSPTGLSDSNFIRLKKNYETNFNKTLYSLLTANSTNR